MLKRILAGFIGGLSLIVAVLTTAAAIKTVVEQLQHEFELSVSFDLLISSLALVSFYFGFRLIRFARFGENEHDRKYRILRAALLGIASFFPGFIFSMPLLLTWEYHRYPGDDQARLASFPVSLCIGVITAIASTTLLVTKAISQRHKSS